MNLAALLSLASLRTTSRHIEAGDTVAALTIKKSGTGGVLDLSGNATTINVITLPDAVASALDIKRASTSMLLFDSATPRITITPSVLFAGNLLKDSALTLKTTAGAWQEFQCGVLQIATNIYFAGSGNIYPHSSATINLQGYDSDGGAAATVARMVPDNNPMFEFVKPVMMLRYAADYGGAFATFTPPTGREGAMIVAEDTNSGSPGRRIYVYSGATWRYVALS